MQPYQPPPFRWLQLNSAKQGHVLGQLLPIVTQFAPNALAASIHSSQVFCPKPCSGDPFASPP